MDAKERLQSIRDMMAREGIDLLVGLHDANYRVSGVNSVRVISNFKPMAPTMAILPRDGALTLHVTPSWDQERAADCAQAVGGDAVGTEDLLASLEAFLAKAKIDSSRIAVAGLQIMPWRFSERVRELTGPAARDANELLNKTVQTKTDEELAGARKATEIAEAGFVRLLETAKPGMREDELATELRCYMKGLGAEDNFFLLVASPRHAAIRPTTGRRIEVGDTILAEITPSYGGQIAQICRTVIMGAASDVQKRSYDLLVEALIGGLETVRPGVTVSDVVHAMNKPLEARGLAEYCKPPYMRQRGHGLGFGTTAPGSLGTSNMTEIKEDMFFIVHPNQFLPDTGYMMCGDPVTVTSSGHDRLTATISKLYEIPV